MQSDLEKQVDQLVEKVDEKTDELKRKAKPWVEKIARFGYTAKGIFYAIIGLLSIQAAYQAGETELSIHAVLLAIFVQPMGRILLAVVALGLLGYVLWRIVQVFEDPDHAGTDWKGLIQRAAYAFSGIGYAFVSYTAFEIVFDLDPNVAQNPPALRAIIDYVLGQPLGRPLVGLAGVIFLGIGLYQFYRTISANFQKHWDWSQLSSTAKRLIILLGRVGFGARGVLYSLIGYFLILAAVQLEADEAGGFGRAIEALDSPEFAPWILGGVAAAVIIYSVYVLIQARYRLIYLE